MRQTFRRRCSRMPPPVDHDEKRRRVIEVASRLLAKSGLGALTVRDVPREAGYSTTIVTHYFKNEDELLTPIFKYNHARFVTITDEALRKSGSDLKAFMTSVMLLEDHSIQWWHVWFAYIAQLDSHPKISSIHRDFTQAQRERWVVILNSMTARGLLKGAQSASEAADADHLGWCQVPSRHNCPPTPGFARGPYSDRLPDTVLSGTQSRPVSVGMAQASRDCELLPRQPQRVAYHTRNKLKSDQRRPSIIAACRIQATLW